MRPALSLSALLLVLGTGPLAHAQDDSSEPSPAQVRVAAEAFDKGREAYKAGEYVEAAEQFEKADSNAPSPAALELAIRARDKAGELDRAATLMALALRRLPDDANLLKISGDLLKRANASLFQLTANCDTPCDLTVRGKIVHGGPDTQRLLYISPGTLTVRAGWPDSRSEAKQVEAEAAGSDEISFTAPNPAAAKDMAEEPKEPVVAPPSAPTKDEYENGDKSSGWSPSVFYVGAGLTAVLGGVSLWSGLDTVNNPGADRVKDECGSQGESCALYQEGVSKQRRTNVLLGVTAGVGVSTLLIGLIATDWSGGKKPPSDNTAVRLHPRVAVAPWASLDAGGLQAFGRF